METLFLPGSARILNEVEAAFPVDEWAVGGIRMWPALRIRYRESLLAGRSGLGSERPEARRLGRRLAQFAAGPARRGLANLLDHSRYARIQNPADVVLLSDGISLANVGGVWVDRFCDPLIAEFARRRLRTLLLMPLHGYRVPRASPCMFIQPEIDRCDIRSLFAPGRIAENLREFEAFERWAAGTGAPAPGREWLRSAARRLRLLADYFGKILNTSGAALGVVVNYYSLPGMAFVLACRERGLPVVDIQHGVAGDVHPAYGSWRRVPPDGFELLPSHFWCWTRADAAAINRWAPKAAHHALAGGHVWLRHCEQQSALRREADALIRHIKSQHPDSIHILVTLQLPANSEPTRKMLAMIRESPPDLFWWVRLHPCQLGEREAVARMVKGAPAEIDAATSVELADLLRHVEVHATYNSTSILEAAWMGIPSVSCSHDGGEIYPQQKRSGWLVEAGFDELAAAARFQAARASTLRLERPDHGDFEVALEELLHAAGVDQGTSLGAVASS